MPLLPQLSTLRESTLALLTHFRSILPSAYPEFFSTSLQIALNPADDELSDFRRSEETQKPNKTFKLPVMVLSYGSPVVTEDFRQWSARENFVKVSEDPVVLMGKGTVSKFNYTAKCYASTADEILAILEIWLLVVMHFRKIEYQSIIAGRVMSMQLEFDLPQIFHFPDVGDRWGNRGQIYGLRGSFSALVPLLFRPNTKAAKILTTKSNTYLLDQTDILVNFTSYHDSLFDIITEESEV